MFLQVMCIVDIVEMWGNKLESWAWEGMGPSPRYSVTDYGWWPRCPKMLSSAHWALWQQALMTSILHLQGLGIRLDIRGKWRADWVEQWMVIYHRNSNHL
jgi:hypothetical protein